MFSKFGEIASHSGKWRHHKLQKAILVPTPIICVQMSVKKFCPGLGGVALISDNQFYPRIKDWRTLAKHITPHPTPSLAPSLGLTSDLIDSGQPRAKPHLRKVKPNYVLKTILSPQLATVYQVVIYPKVYTLDPNVLQ